MEFHLLALATIIISSAVFSIEASKQGFSIEIISRDSPKSPFYNPDETPTTRIANAFRRSTNRARLFNSRTSDSISPETAESVISGGAGEYLMNISVGTPSFEIVAIADTGSDLIWTQCEPCDQCYKQDAPLFDPSHSTTYGDISCSSKKCSILKETGCSGSGSGSGSGICQYQYSYGDSSSTVGNLAVDTLTLGSTNGRPVAITKALFGCGHQNSGTFSPSGSGIVGLGGGPVSLISQLGSTISGKFSYCLVPATSRGKNTSTLNFGSNAIVSGSGVQTTPLISKDPDTFYFLTLEAISVGTKRIEFGGSRFGKTSGNIIIDSGTTLTLVPQDFFSELALEVENQVTGTRVDDPSGFLSLCYESNSNLTVPKLTVHFKGADIELKALNTFVEVSESVICFAFNPIDSGAIFGNLSQMDFLVGYDLQAKTVSFKPTDCANSP
ncbi:aspartic proteinase CDR1-like [Euphorbia lathyris]|uniref:aspartic proteinase CDR1-like n=1 Tax=Euphorbia lathyris TaxID=212925 RepID=UPI003313198D